MKKSIITLAFALGIFTTLNAQTYQSAIGLRGGFFTGITYRHFLSDKMAFEGLATSRYRGLQLTALLEWNNPISEVEGLNWYYGLGAHIGTYNYKYYNYNNGWGNDYYVAIGVDGIIGLEYTFSEFPINLSLDWKPMFNLVGDYYFNGDSGALSIRYCFE